MVNVIKVENKQLGVLAIEMYRRCNLVIYIDVSFTCIDQTRLKKKKKKVFKKCSTQHHVARLIRQSPSRGVTSQLKWRRRYTWKRKHCMDEAHQKRKATMSDLFTLVTLDTLVKELITLALNVH